MLEIADNIKAEHKDHNMFWLPLTLVEVYVRDQIR